MDCVVWEDEHPVRVPASTKRSCRRTNCDLEKVMSTVEGKTLLALPRSLAWLPPVPSIHSSPLKNVRVSDTARRDELFDHTGFVVGYFEMVQ